MITELQKETKSLRNPDKERVYKWFFKTGKGEYGEGDQFYGLTNPICHKLSRKYKDLKLSELQVLVKSKIHEERMIALLILVLKHQKGDEKIKKSVFEFYLKNTKYINSWDLVDLSAHKIVGQQLLKQGGALLLKKLAKSKNLWERRIAIISTFAFLGNNNSKPTLEIAEMLIKDKHDLIHKAVGWALREVGKRVSISIEKEFLDKFASVMPRIMLRYAIERFPEELRQKYLLKTKNP